MGFILLSLIDSIAEAEVQIEAEKMNLLLGSEFGVWNTQGAGGIDVRAASDLVEVAPGLTWLFCEGVVCLVCVVRRVCWGGDRLLFTPFSSPSSSLLSPSSPSTLLYWTCACSYRVCATLSGLEYHLGLKRSLAKSQGSGSIVASLRRVPPNLLSIFHVSICRNNVEQKGPEDRESSSISLVEE